MVNIEITQISLKKVLSAYGVQCEEDNVFFDLEFSSDIEEKWKKKTQRKTFKTKMTIEWTFHLLNC